LWIDDPNVARLYTLAPMVPYNVDYVEDRFSEWITLTRFIYDPARRVRFTAPEVVWSKTDSTVLELFPTMIVKVGDADADAEKWLSGKEEDLKGSSKCSNMCLT
jgi:hypothetical protein